MNKIKSRIWKKDEFREFLATIKEGKVEHWKDIAQAIGVNDNTITAWKQTPEAQDAITLGIARTLENMESSGKKDWRMWAEKLKMLGVNPASKSEVRINSDDPIELILIESGLREEIKKEKSNGGQSDEPVQSSSEGKT